MIKFLRVYFTIFFITLSFLSQAQKDKYRVSIGCRDLGVDIYAIRCNDDSVINTGWGDLSFYKEYSVKPSSYNIYLRTSAGKRVFTVNADESCYLNDYYIDGSGPFFEKLEYGIHIYHPSLKAAQCIKGGEGVRVFEGDQVIFRTEGKAPSYGLFVGTYNGGSTIWQKIASSSSNEFIIPVGNEFYKTAPLRSESNRYGIYYLKVEPEESFYCVQNRVSDITPFILVPSKPTGDIGDIIVTSDDQQLIFKTDSYFSPTSSAEWQISEDNGSTWINIATTAPEKELKLSLNGFCKAKQKYGIQRLLRYKKVGIDNQYASPAIPIKFILPAPTGTFGNTCENKYVSAQGMYIPWTNIEWQVSEDGQKTWQNILFPIWGNTVTLGINDLCKSGSKFYTNRYIRYKRAGSTDDGASQPSVAIVFYPASASLTNDNIEITPASCAGRADGKVIIKNVTGGASTLRVSLVQKNVPVKFSLWDKKAPLVFDKIQDGNYVIQVEDDGATLNCPTDFPITVEAKPAIQFTGVKKVDPSCGGRSDGSITATVKDGIAPREYTLYKNDGKGVWVEQKKISPADLSYTFTALSSGNYKVMASDGCQIVNQEIVLQNPVFAIDTVNTTRAYCGLAYGKITVQMSGGKSPYTYSWKYGAQLLTTTESTAENLLPGIYTVTGTDANGCSGPPLSVEVLEGIHPNLEIKTIQTGCGLAKGEANVKIKQGFSPYIYTWKDKTGKVLRTITRNESSDTLVNLLKDTYQVEVKDSKGCQVQTSVEITEHAPLAITVLSTTLANCPESSDGKASIKVEGGLSPYIYEWNDIAKQTKAEAINLKPGIYSVKVTDALGCSKEQTVEINSIAPLIFTETIKPPTCYETCDAAIDVKVSGGTPPYKYMWSTGVTSNSIQSLCEGSYILTVEDAKKCIKTASYKIVKPTELSGVLKEKEATICSGQVMSLDAGEWKSYSWKNEGGNIVGQDRILKITQAGTYFLEVTNSYGCVIKDQFILHTSTNLLEAKIIFASPVVVGDTVVLTEISWPKPDTWSWTYPSQLITYEQGPAPSQQQVILSEPGIYSIQFIAGLGECRDTIVRTITVLPKSEATNLVNQISSALGSKAITKLSLYPNPNSGKFTLEITLEKAAPVQIQLYGWQSTDPMYQTTFEENTVHKQELEMLGLSRGLYVVVIYVATEKPRLIKLMIE